jgi:tetratricopeptide (TPR) repeat protein
MAYDIAWDVFLCHSSADKPVVREIADALRGLGLRVWFDEVAITPEAGLTPSIEQGLRHSRWVFVCLSNAQLASGWAQHEQGVALARELETGTAQVVVVIVGELDEARIAAELSDKLRTDWRTEAGRAKLLRWIGVVPGFPARDATRELRVRLRAVDEGRIEAHWPALERPPHTFDNPIVLGDARDHRWYLESYLRMPGPGDHARAQRFEGKLDDWGTRLWAALWPHGGAHPLEGLCAHDGPKVLTLVSDDAAVLSLPWELLASERGAAVSRGVSVRRCFANTRGGAQPQIVTPLRVLLAVARPTGTGFIDPRTSTGPMLDALDRLGGNVEIAFCDPPTLPRLSRLLDDAKTAGKPFHVVHFDGHGVYLPQTGVGALCFEQADATVDLVEGKQLGELLAAHEVPLVFLEACQTSDVGATVFGAVAPALLRRGVGSVVAFSHAVTVTGARMLVERFYAALCDGLAVGEALNAGRKAMTADANRKIGHRASITLRDAHIAQLYQAGVDPVLVPGGAPRTGGVAHRRGREPGGFPPKPMYGFTGRAGDLLALRRALRKHAGVVVHGMGGMGKTSLAGESARWLARTGERPDGAWFTTFERRAGPVQACRELVAYVDGQASGSDDAVVARAVVLFRTKALLWVWDNFESTLPQYDADEATAYPPEDRVGLARLFAELTDRAHKPRGWLVVTCRPDEAGLPGARELHLAGLGAHDALDLAEEVLQRKGVVIGGPGRTREDIEPLVKQLDGHPLSLELVLPHLKKLTPAKVREEMGLLLDRFTNDAAVEARNRGLRASLAFSTRRLGDAARAVLPYLAWFDGGAFEDILIDFTELAPAAWDAVREELEAVALARVEDVGVQVGGRGYVRFHPTLVFAAGPGEVADPDAAAARFVAVYAGLAAAINQVLNGAAPAGGMLVASREEGNLRRAARRAFARGDVHAGARLADTVSSYLESCGRARDRARWAAWVHAQVGADPSSAGATTPEALAAERQHAWGLFVGGRAQEAVDLLQAQLNRLAGLPDHAWQRALCHTYLGRVLLHAGRPDLAEGPLREAIAGFEAEGDETNLPAAVGDLANALRALSRLDEALEAAERALEIARRLSRTREVAAGLGRTAAILMDQRRFAEADRRYGEALAAAREAGDTGLEALTLMHQGGLARRSGDLDRAVDLYRDALRRFQALGDEASEMQTCDLLGSAEADRGHLDAAQPWYERSRELATRLGDRHHLGVVAQNLGVLYRTMALASPDPAARVALLRQAVGSVEASLAITRDQRNDPGAAASLSQLGVLHRDLGDLDAAERDSHDSLAIRERLGNPDVWKDFANLEEVADARGDSAAAAAWRAKKEAKLAELRRLAAGPGGSPARLPSQLVAALQQLAQAAHHHRTSSTPPAANVREAFAKLAKLPAPLPVVGAFLHAVATGAPVPPVPPGLPDELTQILTALAAAST